MSYSRQHASNGWRANKGWKHACTEGNLVRVRTADRLREGAPAGQGERHEQAGLHERRQRQAPGHPLGRIRATREQPQPRRVREWGLDEVDAQALIVRLRKTMADLAFGATAMASIFAIVDPLGVVPFFSVLTEDLSAAQKQDIISKACLTATITLGVFAVFGQWIFAGFGFTIPAFKIAGGALLFGVALEMLNGERSRSRLTPQEREETLQREEVSVVPLGIPLLAGPGAITTVMIYMTAPVSDPADKLFVFAGILVAVLSAFVLLHNADRIFRKIGRTGTRAIGRVMGLLLAAIAVQFLIDGIVAAAQMKGLIR